MMPREKHDKTHIVQSVVRVCNDKKKGRICDLVLTILWKWGKFSNTFYIIKSQVVQLYVNTGILQNNTLMILKTIISLIICFLKK